MSQATTSKMPLAGPATQTELSTIENGILDALYSCHSGTSAPSYAVAGTVWLDTTSLTVDGVSGINALKFYDGADWIPLIYVDPTNDRMWADQSFPEISIASAATVDALGAKSPRVFITGDDGPISSLGDTPNKMVWTRLESDTTFTHSAGLLCPGGVDFAASAGTQILVMSDGDGVPTIWPAGIDLAVAADVRAGTSVTMAITPDAVLGAMAWNALTAGATVAVDHAAGVNRSVTHTANATISNPTNAKPGWPLNIDITPSTYTTAWGTAYDFGDDGAPDISARTLVMFMCLDSSTYVYLGTRGIS